MRAAATAAAALVVVLLLGPACDRTPDMTPADARTVARAALADAGLGAGGPEGVTSARCGPSRVAGWRVTTHVGESEVALCIARHSDRIVSLSDPDGVVSDAAFERLEAFRWSPAAERRERTVGWAVGAGCLLAGALVLLSVRMRKERGARGAGGSSQEPFDQDR